jgi:hypothetical protein
MQSDILNLSKETRAKHPYRSLYAAMLFHSFRDAVQEMASMEEDTTWSDVDIHAMGQSIVDSGESYPAIRSF